ncbi:MAG: hypothetical protein AB9834_19265 [Lentimicrobium sp.]
MARDPAFLFYPNDWLGGTMGMTFEEKGAYIHLLMLQFNRGHMTTHMIAQEVGHLWDRLNDKFIQDANGMWYNMRLEEEQRKRKGFTESRRNNMAGQNQHSKKVTENLQYNAHMTSHMETENVNVSVEGKSISDEQKKIRFDLVAIEFRNAVFWHKSISNLINKSPEEVLQYIEEFLRQIEVSEAYLKQVSEIKRYFGNWVRKRLTSEQATILHQPQNYPTI